MDISPPYFPIPCDVHDRIEDIATSRAVVRIRFPDGDDVVSHRETTIADVYARSGVEYLITGQGEAVRLDAILDIDGLQIVTS